MQRVTLNEALRFGPYPDSVVKWVDRCQFVSEGEAVADAVLEAIERGDIVTPEAEALARILPRPYDLGEYGPHWRCPTKCQTGYWPVDGSSVYEFATNREKHAEGCAWVEAHISAGTGDVLPDPPTKGEPF